MNVEIYMNCSYLETFSPGLNMKHATKENKDTLGISNQTNRPSLIVLLLEVKVAYLRVLSCPLYRGCCSLSNNCSLMWNESGVCSQVKYSNKLHK